MALVLGLTAVMLVLFVREALPPALTALMGLTVLGASGVLNLEETLSGFSSPATVAIMAMFVLSAGIERTGGIHRLTDALVRRVGTRLRGQLMGLGLVVAPVSAFLNNTAVVAVMMPAASRMAHDAGRSPSRLLLPVSIFAMLGGTLTLIGTSTNLLGSATMRRLGHGGFSFFEFLPYGLVAVALGLVYFFLLGPRLLPERGKTAIERFDLKGFFAEVTVTEGPAVGMSLEEAGLTWTAGVQVVRATREERNMDAPPPTFRLRAGDRLLVEGSRERLAGLPARGIQPSPEDDHPLPEEARTAEAAIMPGSGLVGRTIAQADLPRRHGVLVLAVRHHGRNAIAPVAATRLAPGDILLVEGEPEALDRLRESPDLFLTRERPRIDHRPVHAIAAVAVLAGVVGLAATGIMEIAIAALAGAVALVMFRILRFDEMVRAVQWEIILLLAGVIPLGIALEKTGAAALLAQGIVHVGSDLPFVWFLILLYTATTLITEVVSNNASVVLLVPVAVAAAAALGHPLRATALVVILAASMSMMTPIGYQTNTMVYGPGRYRFSDFARVGAGLNAALAIAVPVTVWLLA